MSRTISRPWLLLLLLPGLASPASAEQLKIASWNIENLRAPAVDKDLDALRAHAVRLNADVVALQEVDGAEAAKLVFDENEYNFFFSRRDNAQRTGFAVRKSLDVEQHPDFEDLNVSGGLRYGTDITVRQGDKALRLMSVHLKSGCFSNPLSSASGGACEKLARQVPELEEWIDARALEDVPFAVLGDFNRRFNRPGDDFWPMIDDAVPPNADLARVNAGMESRCWHWNEFIDHIVVDRRLNLQIVDGSFEQFIFEQSDDHMDALSDHCPIAVRIELDGPQVVTPNREELLQRIEALEAALAELKERIRSMFP